ncbi:MAG: hypothetical protein QOJ45_206 [Verrucomicrobiota bacterium]
MRTATHRQVARSSFDDTAGELLARSSLDIIVSDLKQEIANAPGVTAVNVKPQAYATPPSGSTPIPNLIRRSASGDPTGRTSNVNSTAVSANGRSISLARWNSHYLIPRASTSSTVDSTPVSSFTAPDWVFITSDGPQLLASPVSTVLGRYAFAVFDEGALLDLNVAGFPFFPPPPASAATPGIPSSDVGRKGSVAFADLTGLPTSPTVITASTSTPGSSGWHSASATNDIVGWRNYASVRPTGSFSSFTFDPATAPVPSTGSRFLGVFLNQARSFLTVSTTTTTAPGRTDQALINRTELLRLRSSSGFSQSVLQYLGTFSREKNRPTSGSLTARWPLSRFDLFATTPPSDAAGIQTYFGLRYVSAAFGPPAAGEHWEYIGASGATRLSAIPASGVTVDSDLPLLLRSTLPSGASTGEILSVVASLIDQRDSNNETTWIEFGDPAGPAQKAYGVDGNPVVDPSPSPSPAPRPSSVVILNRSFRNVGELGYAYRNASTPLDFLTAASTDAPLLDQFTFNTAPIRAGIINLNTGNIGVITALITGATTTEPSTIASRTDAYHSAQSIVSEINRQNAVGRADVARLAGAAGSFFGTSDEARKTVVRALAELAQTRTWNLMIDVVAQSGRYPVGATSLGEFIVKGEKRYWLHIAIDRFTGEVIDQQLEAVYE